GCRNLTLRYFHPSVGGKRALGSGPRRGQGYAGGPSREPGMNGSAPGPLPAGHPGECVSSDPVQFVLVPAVYCLVLCVGLPGNLVALLVFLQSGKVRKAIRIYLINLTLADILFNLTLPPAAWPGPPTTWRPTAPSPSWRSSASTGTARCGPSLPAPGPPPASSSTAGSGRTPMPWWASSPSPSWWCWAPTPPSPGRSRCPLPPPRRVPTGSRRAPWCWGCCWSSWSAWPPTTSRWPPGWAAGPPCRSAGPPPPWTCCTR
uniref:G-protein coupled receptors family 1 profile domain-containing protein n=1 Tax=Aquila chrysaetos chrysaetos TaxID=223781 RepID=A0A663EHA3_AQUCH